MLKRLRRKFVLVGAVAFAIVLAVLVVGSNCALYYFNAHSADSMLDNIVRLRGDLPRPSSHNMQRPWDYPVTEETPFETRYFAVSVDSEGEVISTSLEFISAIDEISALEYLNQVAGSGKDRGYVGRYRFLAYRGSDSGGTIYIFLDCSRMQRTQELVLLVSSVGSLVVLAVTALVLFALSRRAISPVAKSVERQKRFITDAGHEIKTPLTAVIAAADVLAIDMPGNEWVESIRASGSRMAKLTADLIDLSRFDEADPFPDRSVFDLGSELTELCDAFRLMSASQGREVTCELASGIYVNASSEALRRVAGILLDNAMRYSDEGTPIAVVLSRQRSHAVFRVSNTCSSMTKETLSRVFERFYRGDASRSSAGNGVGLSMAQAIVEAHGGHISASLSGSTVSFTLTLATHAHHDAPQ